MASPIDFKDTNKGNLYNSKFVAKIKESRKQVKAGKVTYLKTNDLWK